MSKRINIAIDGYSSCGKSTLAKGLARKLGYKYIDSGSMYRAITLFALENQIIDDQLDKEKLIEKLDDIRIDFLVDIDKQTDEVLLNGKRVEEEIRKPIVTKWVSQVAAITEVREKLVSIQQLIGRTKGVVMDGRDIGTVVFPDAELKIFVTAEADIRARRRWLELREKGIELKIEDVKESLLKRDEVDSNRKVSPLKRAADSKLLDTTKLSKEEQVLEVLNWFKEVLGN